MKKLLLGLCLSLFFVGHIYAATLFWFKINNQNDDILYVQQTAPKQIEGEIWLTLPMTEYNHLWDECKRSPWDKDNHYRYKYNQETQKIEPQANVDNIIKPTNKIEEKRLIDQKIKDIIRKQAIKELKEEGKLPEDYF